MNRLRFIIVLIIIHNLVYAQHNLEIIHYYEAVKIITSHSYNLRDTPVVAIIDNGVNLNQEDVVQGLWINKQEIAGNGIDDDTNGFIDDIYGWNFQNNTPDVGIGGVGNWHGTPINAIIGAEHDNGFGVNGISPLVKLMNIVKGESIESIINSLHYVFMMRKLYNETNGRRGAYIVAVNCSWGKDSLWASDYPEWCSMYDSLGSVGVLSIHSVPNDNIDVDTYGDMPSTCDSDYLITVTNSNQFDEKVYDAGFGSNSVDIAAPGDNTFTVLNTGECGYFSGTSAAAPYVTGLVALLYLLPSDDFQQYILQKPSHSALIVKSVIMNGATSVSHFKNSTVSGGRLHAFDSMKLLCDFFNQHDLYENLFDPTYCISVYPNPARSHASLRIESDADLFVSASIVDINGKSVSVQNAYIHEGIMSVPLDVSCLKSGIYSVQVYSPHITNSIQLIIQK
ncbi:MAG: S8 family serine peptidase [Bacteroidota bacterium]